MSESTFASTPSQLRAQIPRGLRPLARFFRKLLQPTIAEVACRDAAVRRVFHPPLRNNFVDVFFPRTLDRQAELEAMHQGTAPLNEADGELLQLCEGYVRDHPHVLGLEGLEHLICWKGLRQQRSFLEGGPSMTRLVTLLAERSGAPMSALLSSRAPALLDKFCNMPVEVSRVFRLNLYLAPHDVTPLVRQLCEAQGNNPGLFDHLRRMEVAATRAQLGEAPSCPTLMFYFAADARQTRSFAALQSWLIPRLSGLRTSPFSAEYAERWHPAGTMTEGFRLYKRYLAVLGCLDRVYDAETGYAYARSEQRTTLEST